MYCWNSLFFWVDIETRMLKCYDMELRATSIFRCNNKEVVGLNVSSDFIFDNVRVSKEADKVAQLNFNKNFLYY